MGALQEESLLKQLPNDGILYKNKGKFEYYLNSRSFEDGIEFKIQKDNEPFIIFITRVILGINEIKN